jgi:WD40 repeat protein
MGDEPDAVKPVPAEQTLFAEALQCGTPEERATFLDSACGKDAGLRKRIEDLLRAADSAGDFLEGPPDEFLADEKSGDQIGRYKLLEQIGEGGCGTVYMAEQEDPVRRRVALKIIKLGMDTRSVVARFEAERQALALMDHPNIAKVFDGGATKTGRPYFVMELVRGVPITRFSTDAKLSTNAQLHLFAQVCQAIQHAHQKGIIHRDLKPSNILVTVNDGAAVPKVIDFGIAKGIGQRLTDKTLFTHFHSFIGTPAYISPEQAEMSSVDIDTRSDIYSLGVLLYELLTGRTPFDAEKMMRSGLDEMRRTIRDDQPVKPSRMLARLPSPTTGPALDPQSKLLSSDLDWIVMKCLEKDRARRYETASALAIDIQRHLNHQAVTARPPSAVYLFQKFAQRHRAALVALATVVVALLVTLLTLAASNARIHREQYKKDEALASARASEVRAREQLFVSLKNEGKALRNSRQIGQRLESLAAIEEAARIRAAPELRDIAIAAMALADIERGPGWQASYPGARSFVYDSLYQRYAEFEPEGTIIIRDVPSGQDLRRLEAGRGSKFQSVFAFSQDGRFLACLGDNEKLSVWDWEPRESVLNSGPANCSTLTFSHDNRRVAVGHESWISLFDLNTGHEIRRWQTHGRAHSIELDPGGRRLAVGYSGSDVVSIFNPEDGAHVTDLRTCPGSMTTVAWHPDGNLLAAGGSDPRIQIWDVNARRKLSVLEGHFEHVTKVIFHWSGEMLLSASWDGSVRLWQPSPGRLLMQLPVAGWYGISAENNRWMGVVSATNFQAQLWGIVPSQEYRTFLNNFAEGESALREGEISPDGALLALGATDGLRMWDIAQGREIASLRLGDTTSALFRNDGRELWTCGAEAGLRRWPIETNTQVEGGLRLGPSREIALPFAPARMAKGRDDRTLAVVGTDAGQCLLLDLVTESIRFANMEHLDGGFIAVSPDSERLASGGWHSDHVKVWNGRTGKLVKELASNRPSLVFFTPDNRELIVSRNKEFIFHHLNSLEVSRRIEREIGLYPGHVAFSADGKMMALEIAPGQIHLKDFASGRTVAKLEDPNGDRSTWISFSPLMGLNLSSRRDMPAQFIVGTYAPSVNA